MSAQKKISIFYLYKFFSGIWPLGPLMIIFLYQTTGSYSSAGVAYAITFLTQALLEIPTSIISDKYNRKGNLLASSIFFFAASCLWAYSCYFNNIITTYLGCFLSGISAALGSGTDKAMLYEYLKEDNNHDKYNIFCSEYHKYNQFGMIIGLILGIVILQFQDISYIVYISCFFVFIKIILVMLLPKQKNKIKSNLSSLKHFISAFNKIIRRKKLRNMGLISILDYISIQTSHRYEGLYFATMFSDSTIILVRFFKHICGCISFSAIKYLNKLCVIKILTSSCLFTGVIKLLGWLINSPFIISSSHLFYGGTETGKEKVLQDLYTNKERATMDSIFAFFNTLVGSFVLFFAGVIADVFNPKIAMLSFIIINFIVWIAYKNYFKNNESKK